MYLYVTPSSLLALSNQNLKIFGTDPFGSNSQSSLTPIIQESWASVLTSQAVVPALPLYIHPGREALSVGVRPITDQLVSWSQAILTMAPVKAHQNFYTCGLGLYTCRFPCGNHLSTDMCPKLFIIPQPGSWWCHLNPSMFRKSL